MVFLKGKTIFHKLWYFLRTYILTIARFDLFLQGALLVVLLLESNVYLLLRRDAANGHLPGLVADYVLIGTSVVEFILGSCIAWHGRRRRQFALAGCLAVTALSGILVHAFPYNASNTTPVELCGGAPVQAYSQLRTADDGVVSPRVAFLIITATLCALTRLSIWSHGLTYLDDHEPQSGPYFYGILISIRFSLGLAGTNWLRPGSTRDDWWEAHLSLSMLTFMFAVLYTLFPTKMPQYKQGEKRVESGFFSTLSDLLRNKTFMLQICALSLMYAAIFGFTHYDMYFVQARFQIEAVRQDPQSSRAVGDFFRSLVIIFFVSIFRVRFSVRRNDGVKANTAAKVGGVVAILVAIFFIVLAALHCNFDDVAGLTGAGYTQPECSTQCGCRSEVYGFTPVCDLDTSTTYFSPCHAGCNEYEDLNGFLVFQNCTCNAQRVVRGGCSIQSCRTFFSVYQVIYAVVVALTAASLLMQGMVVFRCVKRSDKPLAVGFSTSAVSLLSYIPGHLIYMLISHLTCASKNNGYCILHQSSLWSIAAVSSALALLSAVVSITNSILSKNVKIDVNS